MAGAERVPAATMAVPPTLVRDWSWCSGTSFSAASFPPVAGSRSVSKDIHVEVVRSGSREIHLTHANPPMVDGFSSYDEELLTVSFQNDGENKIQVKPVRRSWTKIYRKEGVRGLTKEALHTPAFDNIMCLVVLTNALCMAFEQSYRLEGKKTEIFDILEHVFLAIYMAELVLNFYSFGTAAWTSHWVKFDFALVLTGIFSSTANAFAGVSDGGNADPLTKMMVLRMVRLLRLARLARTVRLFARCQELWMLARGLLNSFSTAFHTLMFGLVLLFVIGCMAVELIPLTLLHDGTADRNEVVRLIIEENFTSLPVTMLTLVQFITFDNVVYIYKPLIDEHPSLAIFFIVVLLLVGIVFMNLVTAIIVNSGLEQTLIDKNLRKVMLEQKRRQLLMDLEKAFYRMDTNNSGTLSKKELVDIDSESLAVLEGYLGVENLPHMFDVLDVEGSGEIAISEFCDGITSIVLTETQPEIKRIERITESVNRTMRRCEMTQQDLFRGLAGVQESMEKMSRRISAMNAVLKGCETTGTQDNLGSSMRDSMRESVRDSTGGDTDEKLEDMPDWAHRFLTELRCTFKTDIEETGEETGEEWTPDGSGKGPTLSNSPAEDSSEEETKSAQGFEVSANESNPVWEALPPSGHPLDAVAVATKPCQPSQSMATRLLLSPSEKPGPPSRVDSPAEAETAAATVSALMAEEAQERPASPWPAVLPPRHARGVGHFMWFRPHRTPDGAEVAPDEPV